MMLRLDRVLSMKGLSRGRAGILIRAGRVTVNGRIVRDPRAPVDRERDRIEVAGEIETDDGPPVYLAMYKPPGVVTTRSDERGRRTVFDLLPEELKSRWVFPVGRLDRDSEGLLIITNDGALSFMLTDPDSRIEKTYRVLLNKLPAAEGIEELRGGVDLGSYRTRPAEIAREDGNWFRVTITEGKYRQIRKMFWKTRCKVRRLIRIAIGPVTLGDCAPAATRPLSEEELRLLRALLPNRETGRAENGEITG
jgi:23S rRNA pseudouridine2605 synthase